MTPRTPNDRKCPRCGADKLWGYGLAGGGIGFYEYCESDDCDFFVKEQDRIEPSPDARAKEKTE